VVWVWSIWVEIARIPRIPRIPCPHTAAAAAAKPGVDEAREDGIEPRLHRTSARQRTGTERIISRVNGMPTAAANPERVYTADPADPTDPTEGVDDRPWRQTEVRAWCGRATRRRYPPLGWWLWVHGTSGTTCSIWSGDHAATPDFSSALATATATAVTIASDELRKGC
jgi:hypothetical protein